VGAVISKDAQMGILVNTAPCMAETFDAFDEDDAIAREIFDEDKVMMDVHGQTSRSTHLYKILSLHYVLTGETS
jgi:hypothetical protein